MCTYGDRSEDGLLHDERVAGDRRSQGSSPGSHQREGAAPGPARESVCSTARPRLDVGTRWRGNGRQFDDRLSLGSALSERQREILGRLPGSSWPIPLVYYARSGDLVKIGYTTDLRTRMRKLRPDELLAVEPGGSLLEASRHREFSASRREGEWFSLTEDLVAHVSEVAQHHTTPALDRVLTRSPADPQETDLLADVPPEELVELVALLYEWERRGWVVVAGSRICEMARRGMAYSQIGEATGMTGSRAFRLASWYRSRFSDGL